MKTPNLLFGTLLLPASLAVVVSGCSLRLDNNIPYTEVRTQVSEAAWFPLISRAGTLTTASSNLIRNTLRYGRT